MEPTHELDRTYEPIAITGIGCRFPGAANDPGRFWNLLCAGVDAVTDIPSDRWPLHKFYDPVPGKPGKSNTRSGGFVDSIDRFDPHFFGISPREAGWMDPQQRLLLEVAWEALEDGGHVVDRASGSDAGVFIGISATDYVQLQTSFRDTTGPDIYTSTGGALSIAANRISFCFNLRGPSVSVDTACSSSLVAVHLACQSLWRKECSLVLAGGVNAILSPHLYVGFTRMSMLSPDGQCRAFDAGANGFVRSEGAGVVVLKLLSHALAAGDRIYALIRGTAANQDGHTSGLTVPSQRSQEALVREACRQARIDPARVQYVEAHGTGTPIGDPIEARALGTVLAEGRREGDVCLLGSVKTNIGHLEAGSGIAGLIKTALALRHRMIPPNLHFHEPSPYIAFDTLRLRVPRVLEPWPPGDGPATAGVNSFGFGGTNAHVVLQEAPAVDPPAAAEGDASGPARLVPLSARSAEALPALAAAYRELLSSDGAAAWADLVYSASLRRTHHDHRLATVAHSREELASQLEAVATGEAWAAGSIGRAAADPPPRVAFVFAGQGQQWWAMGRQLLAEEPVFSEMIERCDRLLGALGDWSLLTELTAEESRSRLQETAIAQPAIFALQVALAALWRSWGIQPDAVVGHSVGEVAAAHVAGVLGLEDATRVIFHRGRCMELAPDRGRMLAVAMSEGDGRRWLSGHDGLVGIAAINSPTSLTFSGDAKALEDVARALEAQDVHCRFVQVNYAFHSYQMEPVRDEVLRSLGGIEPGLARIPLFSTVTGQRVTGPEMDADYWWQNVRQPVRFAEAIDQLADNDYSIVLELSAHPTLTSAVAECVRHRGKKATVLASLRRNEEERATLLRTLGALYTLGCPVDWARLAPAGGRLTRLPSYPWQRERYWRESDESREARLGDAGHPLLGSRLDLAYPTWQGSLDRGMLPYLQDHSVQGHVLLPGTAFLEMALTAAADLVGAASPALEDVKLLKACFLPEDQTRVVHTVFDPGSSTFTINSRPRDRSDLAWTTHASGVYRARPDAAVSAPALHDLQTRCPTEIARDDCYRVYEKSDFLFGPAFRGIERLWLGQDEALGLIETPGVLIGETEAYRFHPAVLDACFQVIVGAVLSWEHRHGNRGEVRTYLPAEYGQVKVYGRSSHRMWCHVRLVEATRQILVADVKVLDEAGALLLEVRGLAYQYIGAGGGMGDTLDDLLYEYRWQFHPRRTSESREWQAPFLPALSGIAESARPLARRLTAQLLDGHGHREFDCGVNDLCAAFIVQALERLGARIEPGRVWSTARLPEELGVAPQHRRLFARYLEILGEDGLLERVGPDWEVRRAPGVDDPRATYRALLGRMPAFFAELTLIRRCGQHLAEVLRGEINPLEILFPQGSLALMEHFYATSPVLAFYNTLAEHAISRALERLPDGRTVRILEIGAGTGGLSGYVLPRVPADRTEYVFTDVSTHFFMKAQDKFRSYPFVQYHRLDIEKNPAEQDLPEHSFDLILASLVVHATADLREALAHVKQLLAPGGGVLFIEPLKPIRWTDMVFGMTEGWWRFTDVDLRPSHLALSFPQWKGVLEELAFTEVTDVAESDRVVDGLDEFGVIIARGPSLDSGEARADVAPARPDEAGRWLVFADQHGIGDALAGQLRARGERVTLVLPGPPGAGEDGDVLHARPDCREDMTPLLEGVLGPGQPACRGVVYLWGLDGPTSETEAGDVIEAAQTPACLTVVHLAQAWNAVADAQTSRLWIVTRGAESPGKTDAIAVAQTPLWGLGRVIINEDPKLGCKLVDLGWGDAHEQVRSLVEELLAPDQEDEIALRGAARYVHRYLPTSVEKLGQRTDRPTDRPFALEMSRFGTLDGLRLCPTERRAPGPGMVEIQIAAAALNFSDVMKALGLYPGLDDGPVPLGVECAGTISTVGDGVDGLRVGDEVIAIAPFSLASFVITQARFVALKPAGISFEEGATIPIAFLTAHYALHHVGRLDRGERVLIHSATGGVGLAAVQLARNAGAEIFATAGTPEKREFLDFLGVSHVMDSRTLAFADDVLERTGGRGVDVVLNSLAGDAIDKGLSILGDYGRFLEIGKRDIYQNSRVGLRPFRKNVSFTAIDLDRTMRDRPELLAAMFQRIVEDVRAGTLSPLLHRTFPIANVVEAFRHMAQAKHIGKVVISMRDGAPAVAPRASEALRLDAEATYLITGGLGGFGRAVADWMVARGARHLALLGRTGAQHPDAARAVEALEKSGARVLVVTADVTDKAQVTRALGEIGRALPPVRGVVHAAMILEDCLLVNLTRERLQRVLGPKVAGAWHLHEATLGCPLDFFVLFSSLTSVFGGPGQANYASGNAFLDGLAHYRRARGLPALSINWGYLRDVGYVARTEKLGDRLEAQGFKSFSPREALTLLERLIAQGAVQVSVTRADWGRLRTIPGVSGSPRFSVLSQPGDGGADGAKPDGMAIRRALLAAPPERRKELMLVFIRDTVARVLGAPVAKVDVDKPLAELGFDSLIGFELRNWIEGEMRVSLPVVELMQGPTVARLADLLLQQLAKEDSPSSGAKPELEKLDEVVSTLEQLSEEEAKALLAAETS